VSSAGLDSDADERAAALVRSACSSDPGLACELLAADPSLARHDLACACVTGDGEHVLALLSAEPELARAELPPIGHAPILYVAFTRLGRVQPDRVAGIRAAARALLDAGADPNASFDHEGWLQAPVYGAAGIANDELLTRMLLEAGADPDDVYADADPRIGEALYHASEFPDPACAALLIDAGTDRQAVRRALGRALNFPNEAIVAMFCEHGARATSGHLHQAVLRRRPLRTVMMLLEAGAPVDRPNEAGRTALANAVRWGSDDVAELLLERGADPASVSSGDRELGRYLSDGGSAPERPDRVGVDRLLDWAIQGGDALAVGRLLDAGAAVDGDPADEHPPIGQAAWRGHAEVVHELVARGARLTFPRGGSAVGAALHGSRHCHDPEGGPTMRTVQEVPVERYARVVEILLEAGAPVPERIDDEPPVASLLDALGVRGS
jgi:ankyrin repeat protein